MKKLYRGLSGLLWCAVSLFEMSELKRFSSLLAEGNTEYIGDVIVKSLYILAIIIAGVLVMSNCKKAASLGLCFAGGVALYKAFMYAMRIMGNSMIFGIVLGNVIDMIEIVLFAAPVAVAMLSGDKIGEKAVRGYFISAFAALAVGLGGRIITFVSWGKSFLADMGLFFEAYGIDILCTLVMFASSAFYIWYLVPEKRKKRR